MWLVKIFRLDLPNIVSTVEKWDIIFRDEISKKRRHAQMHKYNFKNLHPVYTYKISEITDYNDCSRNSSDDVVLKIIAGLQ